MSQALARLKATAAGYKSFEEVIKGKVTSIKKSIDAGKTDATKGAAKMAKFTKRIASYKEVLRRLNSSGFEFKEVVYTADGGDVFAFDIDSASSSLKAIMALFPEGKFKQHSVRSTKEATVKLKGVLTLLKVLDNSARGGLYALLGAFSDVTYDADPLDKAEQQIRRITG
jgi:hypothetical protein